MTRVDHSLPVQADLRYLVTLHPGQAVALLNFGKYLIDALQKDGLEIQALDFETLEPASLDSIFIATPFQGSPESILQNCANSLKPNGQLLLCFQNHHSLKRLKNRLRGKSDGRSTLKNIQQIIEKIGLKVEATYGIHDNFNEPRFFVPLENQQIPVHFFENVLTPYTQSTRLLQHLAPLLIRMGLKRILFADLCLIARSA